MAVLTWTNKIEWIDEARWKEITADGTPPAIGYKGKLPGLFIATLKGVNNQHSRKDVRVEVRCHLQAGFNLLMNVTERGVRINMDGSAHMNWQEDKDLTNSKVEALAVLHEYFRVKGL